MSLDVHILVSKDTNRDWIDQSIQSAKTAIQNVKDYDINLFIVDAIPNHIGKSRKRAISLGNSKYVTAIDDDDYVDEKHFLNIVEKLKCDPDVVYFGEIWIQNGHYEYHPDIQHHWVMRRTIAEQINFDNTPAYESDMVRECIYSYPNLKIINTLSCSYYHRIYFNSHGRILRRLYKK